MVLRLREDLITPTLRAGLLRERASGTRGREDLITPTFRAGLLRERASGTRGREYLIPPTLRAGLLRERASGTRGNIVLIFFNFQFSIFNFSKGECQGVDAFAFLDFDGEGDAEASGEVGAALLGIVGLEDVL